MIVMTMQTLGIAWPSYFSRGYFTLAILIAAGAALCLICMRQAKQLGQLTGAPPRHEIVDLIVHFLRAPPETLPTEFRERLFDARVKYNLLCFFVGTTAVSIFIS